MDRLAFQDLDEDSFDDLDFDPSLPHELDGLASSDDEDDGLGTEFTLTSDSPHTHSVGEDEGEEDDLLDNPPFSFDDLASGDALEELELWEELIGGEGNLDWPHDFGFLDAEEALDSTAYGAGTFTSEDQSAAASLALPAGTASSPPRSLSSASSTSPALERYSLPRDSSPHAIQMTNRTSPAQATGETSNKRQKIGASTQKDETNNPWSDDDLFGDKDPAGWDNLDTIDLTDPNEVVKDASEPEVDNRIKLSTFQCVICMDDVSDLTVTHCGHLYCAECLHHSLNTGAMKGRCPMCRQKLDMKPRTNYTTKTKGFWPLELKLMTKTRKGKRKADAVSP